MISVCMAAYNGEKYIEEQVRSILPQLAETDELIVSDDGSTDRTVEILENFNDKRIKIFHHQRNLKPVHHYYSATKNFENALTHAKGDYIFLSDQDDVWLPNKVTSTLPLMADDVLVISDAWIVNDNLEKQEKLSKYMPYKKGYTRNFYRNTTQGCRCAFSQKIRDFILPIPDCIVTHDVWLRQLTELKFKVVYLPEPLILYRRHFNNLSDMKKSKNSLFFMVKYRASMLYESLKRFYLRK